MAPDGGLPLTLTVALTTGQHYRAACDCRTVVCGVRAVIYYYHGTQINFCSWWRSIISGGPDIVTDLITPRSEPRNRSPYRSVQSKIISEGLRDEPLWNRLTDRILIARQRLHSMQRGKNGRPNFGIAPLKREAQNCLFWAVLDDIVTNKVQTSSEQNKL